MSRRNQNIDLLARDVRRASLRRQDLMKLHRALVSLSLCTGILRKPILPAGAQDVATPNNKWTRRCCHTPEIFEIIRTKYLLVVKGTDPFQIIVGTADRCNSIPSRLMVSFSAEKLYLSGGAPQERCISVSLHLVAGKSITVPLFPSARMKCMVPLGKMVSLTHTPSGGAFATATPCL
mmetsp:Transcript_70108/g.146200  ORF Transcript_70108/g.146200 Transcript_70108/m.146200 type:complete len:178 (-) Transcript_70108:170-703(-)